MSQLTRKCKEGLHDMIGHNLIMRPGHGERCRECKNEANRKARLKTVRERSISDRIRRANMTPEQIAAKRKLDTEYRAARYASMSSEERRAKNARNTELRRQRKAGLTIRKPVEEYDQNGEPILKKNPLDYLKLTPEQALASDALNAHLDHGPGRPPCESDPDRWAFDPDVAALIPSNKVAQEMCASCPFAVECGKYAESLESTGVSGVWSGVRYSYGRVIKD